MKIIDILNQKKVTLSFEVFPPKTEEALLPVEKATEIIAALRPDFMSVTYGAGGGTSKHTTRIAADLEKKYGTNVLAHRDECAGAPDLRLLDEGNCQKDDRYLQGAWNQEYHGPARRYSR